MPMYIDGMFSSLYKCYLFTLKMKWLCENTPSKFKLHRRNGSWMLDEMTLQIEDDIEKSESAKESWTCIKFVKGIFRSSKLDRRK